MTTGSKKHAAPAAGVPKPGGDAAGGEAFMDRLEDRLSKETDLPAEEKPAPVVVPPPPGRSFPAMHETSDIRTLPSSGGLPSLEDDALDVPPPPAPPDSADAFAEFEDELEGETTRIDDSHLLAEASTAILEEPPGQPFLLVEKGNDEGREFVLQEGENGVGRGIDNDVILADVAVSRRHLRIIRQAGELILKDLGSGNGTQLNGKKVSTATLAEGDRIELGETTLVVRTPGAAFAAVDTLDARGADANTDESHIGGSLPPPAPMGTPADPFAIPNGPGYSPELTPSDTLSPHTRRTPAKTGAITLPRPVFLAILLAGALLLAMFGAAVALLALRAGSDDEPEAVTLVDADAPYDRGVRAYQAHQWDEAEAAFREAVEEGENPRATDYLGRIAQARTHAQSIAQARAALEAGDDNRAISLATSVPEDSPLASEARGVAQRARTAQVRTHIEAGRRALMEGNLDDARDHLGQARNIDAESALVRAFENEIQMRTGEDVAAEAEEESDEAESDETDDEAEADEADADAAGAVSRGRRRGPRRGRSRGRSRDRSAVITPYLAGDFSRAAAAARSMATSASGRERSDLTALAGRIDRFGSLWRRVSGARFAASVRPQMEQAMALDRQIARSGQYRDRMRPHVVRAYLADARRQRSNPVASCSAVRQALRVESGNAEARQMASGCEAQARGMMIEARGAPPSRAMSVYGRVLLMVPPTSSVYREASQRRAQLGRRTAVDEDE